MAWDPAQYARYADERGRPFADLTARIACAAPRRVVDLGCGDGALTATLAARWPDARVEGLDSSAEMVAAAVPGVDVRLGAIADWMPTPDCDVVVSNAALQWVPKHRDLLRAWAGALPRGGWLAVQVPGNFDAPSHALMRAVAAEPRFAAALDGVLRLHDAVGEPAEYAALLLAAGLTVDVWETTYLHVLTGTDPVLEWVRGTGLRPVLAALGTDDAAAYVEDYAARLRAAYPQRDGRTLFPFRRLFVVAHR